MNNASSPAEFSKYEEDQSNAANTSSHQTDATTTSASTDGSSSSSSSGSYCSSRQPSSTNGSDDRTSDNCATADVKDDDKEEEDENDGTQFEDARSSQEQHGWFSSQETSFNRGGGAGHFATPAAPSAEASVSVISGVVVSDNPVGNMMIEVAPAVMLIQATTDEDSTAATTAMTPQPSSTSTPSPPRLAPSAAGGVLAASSIISMISPTTPLPPPQPRIRTNAPTGVYGGPGTAYPQTLLKRRLAAFPVVVPDGVDPGVPPSLQGGGGDLADLLTAWEAAEATATCGICQRAGGARFLGYPVCDCPHLHSRCALVCALLAAPDAPDCPACRRRLRLHRVGRVKPSGRLGGGGGPTSEAWFSVSMVTGLSTAAALLAVSVALLLTIIEPENRSLLMATDQPLLAGLFTLLGIALLSCFLIGWLLDRCTAAAWEIYSSRLQIAFCPDRVSSSCEMILAASLMACTFLDYRATSYPYPKRPSAYVNHYYLRQPSNV